MNPQVVPLILAALLLTLGGVLWVLRLFLAGDLAALLGALAILMTMVLAGLLYLYVRGSTNGDGKAASPREMAQEWAQDPLFRSALIKGLLATDLTTGLWIGFIATNALVALPAFCLSVLAFRGLLGVQLKGPSPITWVRTGTILVSTLLGAGLRAMGSWSG